MTQIMFIILEIVFIGLILAGLWLIFPPLAMVCGGVSGLYIVYNLQKDYGNVSTVSDE